MKPIANPNCLQANFGRVLNILYPPHCANCAAPVADTKSLCADCWPTVQFGTLPNCNACGLPFDFDLLGKSL